MKFSRTEMFHEGLQRGYRQGFEAGYQAALDDLRKQIREERGKLEWEDMRNGKVYSGAAEDQA